MTITSSTVGKNPLEEMEQALKSTKFQNAALGCSLINGRMISVHFQGKPFNITVILVYVPNTTAKDAEVDRFFEGPKEVLELTLKKKGKENMSFSS